MTACCSRWYVKVLDNDSEAKVVNLNWEEVQENTSRIASVLSNERITPLEHFQVSFWSTF